MELVDAEIMNVIKFNVIGKSDDLTPNCLVVEVTEFKFRIQKVIYDVLINVRAAHYS